MPRSNKGYKYILCIIDEVTNYLIMVLVPTYQSKVEEIGDAGDRQNMELNLCQPF